VTKERQLAIRHFLTTSAAIVGVTATIGAAVAAGFGAYYGFETKDNAEAKRSAIWRVVQQKEDKADAKAAREALSDDLKEYFGEQRRTNDQILDELKTVRQRTWELLQDK